MNEKTLRTLEYHKVLDKLKDFAVSDKGKEELKNLRPITNKQKIKRLLQETDEALKIIFGNGNIPLEGFYDLSSILKKASIGSMLTLRELLEVGATLRVVKSVKKYWDEIKNKGDYIIISDLIESLVDLNALEKEISKAIISEEELSDHASPELFNLRRQINNKHQNIKDRLNGMITSSHYQKYLQDQIITIRQGRYVIPVKQEHRSNVAGIVHDQSSTGATLYIEPMAIVEMNNDLKKLKLEEAAEVERILRDFTNKVANFVDELSNNYKVLLELDILFAKAKYAIEINGVCPEINDELKFYFKQARHPLIDKKEVVASDIYIGQGFNTLVITGPNTGGKTVALKTVGLLCLMVQSGLFIPVKDGSSVCIHQEIFADIGDEQSIEQSLSTFSSHMTNIVSILNRVGPGSLVLLDELGAGTDPTEGAAIAMSILDYLRSKDVNTMVTTHYAELKQYAISQEGVENASVEFNVKTLRPTYKLLIGIPGKSNAFAISESLGLSPSILDSARKYLSGESIRFEDVLKDIEERIKETKRQEEIARRERQEVTARLEELRRQQEEFELKREELEREAREKALSIIEEASKEAQEIIKSMKEIKRKAKEASTGELEELKRKLDDKEKGLEQEIKSYTPKIVNKKINYKKGDNVLINSLNQKGYILDMDKDGTALIEVGIIKTKVKLEDLSPINEEKTYKSTFSKRSVLGKARHIKSSIDLRGMTAEEAILEVEKFIDNALLANLSQVTIIHGKGTGVLRQTIHELLKKNKHVKEYRLGEYNEGGSGATIATLK